MATSTKPTVLFVHGSWHTSKHFTRVRELFEENGFPTSCPDQPSVGQLPPIGLEEDAHRIADELKQLVEVEEKDVIVVAHSYGGVIATQAVHGVWAKAAREAQGLKGGVIHLIYVCAFLPLNGESLGTTLMGDNVLPSFILIDDEGMCVMLEPERRFYSDLPKEEQDRWVSELKPCPAVAQLTPITYTAYLHHPVTYLFCDGDEALPVGLQQAMVNKVSETTEIHIATETCTAGHSPFLSQPEAVLKVVANVAAV